MERIYLDNAAATPIDQRVLYAMLPFLTTQYGNPSSLHYFGQQARAAVHKARAQVAHSLGVQAQNIVFTSGGTEADNLAIRGYLQANHPDGGHIITTAVEHHAVLNTFQEMAYKGYNVTFLPVDENGRVDVADVQKAIRQDTILISVMYANNETGTVQPVKEIGMTAHKAGVMFHVDAVQAFGYIPIRPLADHIDLLTLCGHKIYGPKGVGALYVRQGLKVAPEAYGGSQEHHLRAGTENVAGIVGLGAASAILEEERQARCEQAAALKHFFYEHLIQHDARFRLNGSMTAALPNIINFSIRDADGSVILIALDMKGLAVSAGAACESGAVEPSHVLSAMHVHEPWLRSSIRVSFGKENTREDIEKAVHIIKAVLDLTGSKEDHHE
ncbi:MAG: cysteine desulfurase [Megasphaera cerevisiae]|jgi:cysteine desulfurase|nr:cysteine desulfurase [Megasphaera cerevisiae]